MRANSEIGLMAPEVHLFHSRKKCEKYLKGHFAGKCELFGTEGQMVYGGGIAVVLMEHRGKPETELSLLVHEAYHAAVAHMGFLGEDDAGEETMAYLIQTIANGLFEAHERWKRGKGLTS